MRLSSILISLAVVAAAAAHAQDNPPVRRVVATGVTVLPLALVEETARTVLQGTLPENERRTKALEAVVALYRQRGYVLAQVTGYQLDPDGTFRLTLAEGRVRRVTVLGVKKTRASTVVDALSARPGAVYNENAVRADRQRLARLGIFRDIQVSPTPATDLDDLGLVDVTAKIIEASTSNVAATVGYSDGTGLIGFLDLSEINFLGTAQRIALQWQRYGRVRLQDDGTFVQDQARTAFNLSFAHPALAERGLSYAASIYDQNTVFLPTFGNSVETIRTYEQRRGARFEVGRRVASRLSVFATARHDRVGYDPNIPLRVDPPKDIDQAKATIGAVGLFLLADQRDRIDSPRRGAFSQLRYESAGRILGGDRRFTQTQLDLRRYLPLVVPKKPGSTLAVRALGGTSSGNVPLSEQYFLGGFDLLRGYDFFSIRGDRMLLGSAEGRVPLGADTSGVVFLDWGGAWLPGQPVAARNLKAGVGVGLRFQSPVGPIRFDLAYGDQVRTYVSLGQAF